ncbi:MAG: hypothetical protein NTW03_13470, partial [Verrucomicrobia bacterium]|nr:hypothetical protein [Verrucomicrobiota bacterium]
TYNAPLQKYLMCVTDGGNTVSRYNTYLLESDRLAGPWRLVAHLNNFGEQAYFVNIPSKFIGADGRTLWLCYAANFSSGWGGITFKSRPPGSRYGMCLQEVRLLAPTDPVLSASPLNAPENIAPLAAITVSSTHPDYSTDGLTDGVVDGFPGDIRREWCSRGERDTAMVRLTWSEEQTIDRVWLFDRPNKLDQIRSGLLVFSDGTSITTGELPDEAKKGLEVKFPPRRVKWLIFAINEVKPGSPNIGLSEIAVFRTR